MAVQNSLVNRNQKGIFDAGCSEKSDQQGSWREKWDKICFQYCIRSADNSGTSGVYKPKYFISCIIRRGVEPFSFPAIRTVLYGAFQK